MNEEIANKVWDILVEHAGAYEGHRESFIHAQEQNSSEFRFSGELGFGGKLWVSLRSPHRQPVYVSYYKEDESKVREAIVERVNLLLKELMEREGL